MKSSRLLFLIALLVAPPARAQSAAPPLPSLEQASQERVYWGMLTRPGTRTAFELFDDWLKQTARNDNGPAPAIVDLYGLWAGRVPEAIGAAPGVRPGEPAQLPSVGAMGENFQAARVAVAPVDSRGQPLALRPLSAGFSDGERFKLQVRPTFDALVVIDSLNAGRADRQLYPAKAVAAVFVAAGQTALLPLDAKEYLQFNAGPERPRLGYVLLPPRQAAALPAYASRSDKKRKSAGPIAQPQPKVEPIADTRKLRITVRDSRSLDPGHAAEGPVYRLDRPEGSGFVQMVADQRFPVIAETIVLEARKP